MAKSLADVIKYRQMQSDDADLKDNIMKEAEMVTDNMAGGVDKYMTRQRLEGQVQIEAMKMFHRQVVIESDFLRFQTSEKMVHQDYRFISEGKNPAVINFDDYELTKEKVEDNTPR